MARTVVLTKQTQTLSGEEAQESSVVLTAQSKVGTGQFFGADTDYFGYDIHGFGEVTYEYTDGEYTVE